MIMKTGEILLYKTPADNIRVEVLLQDETVWLSQEQMAMLFGKSKSTINGHIQNLFKEEEFNETLCFIKYGNSGYGQKAPYYYNLDVIILIGYRVKSRQVTRFRIWAIQKIKKRNLKHK